MTNPGTQQPPARARGGPGAGKTPTAEDIALAELAKRFTPDKQVEFLQSTASRVLTQTALIGTVLGAGGLIALATIISNPVAFWLAVAAVFGSFLAVLLALSTQVTVLRKIRVGDLEEIKRWYERYRGWRGVFLSVATWVLLISVLCAVAAVVVGMANRSTQPTFDVTVSVTPGAVPDGGGEPAPDTYSVKASFAVQPEGDDEVVTLTITSDGDVRASNKKRSTGEAATSVAASAAALPTDGAVTVTGESNSWTCEATIDDGAIERGDCDEKELSTDDSGDTDDDGGGRTDD